MSKPKSQQDLNILYHSFILQSNFQLVDQFNTQPNHFILFRPKSHDILGYYKDIWSFLPEPKSCFSMKHNNFLS